jgi:transposase
MNIFLVGFVTGLDPGAHAMLIPDRAGWNGVNRLVVSENVAPVPLSPCSPEPSPVERVWL